MGFKHYLEKYDIQRKLYADSHGRRMDDTSSDEDDTTRDVPYHPYLWQAPRKPDPAEYFKNFRARDRVDPSNVYHKWFAKDRDDEMRSFVASASKSQGRRRDDTSSDEDDTTRDVPVPSHPYLWKAPRKPDPVKYIKNYRARYRVDLSRDDEMGSFVTSAPKSQGINMAELLTDPDGESSSLCTACTFPIFSTPYVSLSRGDDGSSPREQELCLHNQCADLPHQILHELHPHRLLLLNHLSTPPPTCSNCIRICGTFFYQCPGSDCDFRLDLVCVMQIKIMHRSHHHSMMVIKQREAAFLTCGACDTKHIDHSPSDSATLSYLCNLCSFWIHPDCASIPNSIIHYYYHRHSLFLTYNLPNSNNSKCDVCDNVPKTSSGVYICLHCSDYRLHIRCALKSFKPVFLREAKVADLCRLPLVDDKSSLMPYIREGSGGGDHIDQDQRQRLHPHPLTFHETEEENQSSLVCNACAQFISSPFFTCSQCPNFFLHASCAHLPSEIRHRVHRHPLSLSSEAPEADISASFQCRGCGLRCNGFAYSCKTCDDFIMDVGCALINPAITHESHEKRHILFMCSDVQFSNDQICNCCRSVLSGICYECSICHNFKIHVRCSLLPITTRHIYDEHPLQLITTGNGDYALCEFCEKQIDTKPWYYGCIQCSQSFHIDCIPSVDQLSKIKLGSTIRVEGHDCALTLVREDDVDCVGNRCGICRENFKSLDNGLAYQCSNCYFGIHHDCAAE